MAKILRTMYIWLSQDDRIQVTDHPEKVSIMVSNEHDEISIFFRPEHAAIMASVAGRLILAGSRRDARKEENNDDERTPD